MITTRPRLDISSADWFIYSDTPQTNGKAERFNRTLATEWAYATVYDSSVERVAALPTWLHGYNHHRPHTALGGLPPVSRVTNVRGCNT